jgi:hypothetical protein
VRRLALPAAVLLFVILASVWFLNERFQRPTFPLAISMDGFSFVTEESATPGADPRCSHGPMPGEASSIGGLDVFRGPGVPADGGNLVDGLLGGWGGEVRAGEGGGVVGLRSNGAPNQYQPGWAAIAVIDDDDCWVTYYLT